MKANTAKTEIFDEWIRTRFVELNSALEDLYFAQADRANVAGVGEDLKVSLEQEGQALIAALLEEGNTDQGFDKAFDLLGNVGLYMAACRRHEITEPSRETKSPLLEASALSLQIGASIGVTPRFATAHLTTHNRAVNGRYKRFTDLPAEKLFVEFNTRGILAYKRAADALVKIQPLGISHPLAHDLMNAALVALQQVIESNKCLFEQLDAERFFQCVRPYYKPYRVGSQIYRGANAGDFAGINVIDLLLGLCQGNDPSYGQLLVDKFLFMMPEDQQILRDCMRRTSLLDYFLQASEQHQEPWYQANLKLFLELCQVHGETATQHHNQLVDKYITAPSAQMPEQYLDKLTASGPPLPVLLASLEKLRDRRTAAQRADIPTRYHDIKLLKATLE